MKFQVNDGGRAAAGYHGEAADCVCRAVSIASDLPYQAVYDALAEGNSKQRQTRKTPKSSGQHSARNRILTKRKWFDDYMTSLGFRWVPTMQIGQGCKVHLKDGELPMGRLVVSVSKHMAAVIDGVLNDAYQCDRDETRCVYGYYIKESRVA